jgi:hypothetical protein
MSSPTLSYRTQSENSSGLCIGHNREGSTPVSLDDATLRAHTLVIGKNSSSFGPAALVTRLVAQQVARGGGFLVLDSMIDRELRDQLARLMADSGRTDAFRIIDVDVPNASHTYNPLPYANASLAATRLLLSLETFPDWSACKDAKTPDWLPDAVANLIEMVPVSAPNPLSALVELLEAGRRAPASALRAAPKIEPERVAQEFQRISKLLLRFIQGKFGEVLDCSRPEVDLTDVLAYRQGLYVPLPSMGKDATAIALGKMFLSDLSKAVAASGRGRSLSSSGFLNSLRNGGFTYPEGEPPFLVLINDFNLYFTEGVEELFHHAQAANVALVLFESSLSKQETSNLSAWNWVHFYTHNILFTQPYASDSCITRHSEVPPEELKALKREQAVLQTRQGVQRLTLCDTPVLGEVPVFQKAASVR